MGYRNAYSTRSAAGVKQNRKDSLQAPASLIHSFKAAYLNANKQEAPFVRYACGRFYVAGTTGTGMTHDQFSSLVIRLQSRANRFANCEEPSCTE